VDKFSGDAEVPVNKSSSKTINETTIVEKDNLLSALGQEYSKLPSSFFVADSLLSGIELLRTQTSEKKIEIGGIIFENNKNELKIQIINPTKDSNNSMVRIDCKPIDEKNIDGPLFWESRSPGVNQYGHDIYLVKSELADRYRHLFKKLIRDGKNVLIDSSLIARIHSHPSGNLPSPGDFDLILWGKENISNVVLTEDWVYFLVPTIQTPDLSVDTDGQYKTKDPYELARKEDEEDIIVDHLLSVSQKENRSKALNAVRLKVITDECLKNNIGFYALARGESIARRIV
jgi:hypothetical protein